jgi:hypothetical protein
MILAANYSGVQMQTEDGGMRTSILL